MGFSTQPKPNPLDHLASTFSIDQEDHEIPGGKRQSSWDDFSFDDSSSNNIQSKDTLQSIVNGSCHIFHKDCFPPDQGTLLSLDQNKLLHDIESCLDLEPDCTFGACSHSVASGDHKSKRTRLRWNEDLHNKFMDCVNRLGGAEKATPRAILKLMEPNSKGELTILHVKSHLQKFRYSKCMSESTQGKHDNIISVSAIDDIPTLSKETSKQTKEILRIQLDLQRHLYEQLEMQKNLQQMIEEQGRQLKVIMLQQLKSRKSRGDTLCTNP